MKTFAGLFKMEVIWALKQVELMARLYVPFGLDFFKEQTFYSRSMKP